MSAQLQVTGEAKIRDIQGPVVANSGVVTALDGAASQYVRGDGTLADFPTSSGGGSSVSYYLNSSVSQGTIGGVAYRELSKEPIIGAGTDIAISANGYVANYITDVNDPDVVLVPGGNFNCEFYFSVSNDTGNPTTYAELYKYDGTTFTLLGTSVGVPESINQGTTIAPYYFAIPVATAALSVTDRLAIRIYVNVDSRTVTLHTENGHLCQVVTTLSKGMVSLNNLTDQSQYLATGTSGTNFGIVSSGDTHTFNLPVASATNTGKLSSTDWSTFNGKVPYTGAIANVDLGNFNFDANNISGGAIIAKLNGPASSPFVLKSGSSGYTIGDDAISLISSPNVANTLILASNIGVVTKTALIGLGSLTANRTFTLPDASGTLALTSNLSSYVPYTGATANVDLGTFDLTADVITGATGSFSSSGGSDTFAINHSSGSGIALNITKGGNNEGLYINKTSGSGNAATIIGTLNATTLVKSGGTSSQFLMADGSVNTSVLPSGAYLPLTGGTLTGALSGTSATFSGETIVKTNSSAQGVSIWGRNDDFAVLRFKTNDGTTTKATIYTNPNDLIFETAGTTRLTIASTGAATFSSSVTAGGEIGINGNAPIALNSVSGVSSQQLQYRNNGTNKWQIYLDTSANSLRFFNSTNSADRVTFLENGNVGIGTSSPTTFSGNTVLSINNAAGGAVLELQSNGTSAFRMATSSGDSALWEPRNVPILFGTNNTERMRITSGGIVCVGKSDGTFGNVGHALFQNGQVSHVADGSVPFFLNRLSSDGDIALFYRSSSPVGSISVTTSSTSYNTSSDYRLKQDLKDYNALELISAIKTYDYEWKSDKSRMYGVVAHELQEVIPYAVQGQKDELDENGKPKMQGVDYSKLVPILVKSIQELEARIKQLENK